MKNAESFTEIMLKSNIILQNVNKLLGNCDAIQQKVHKVRKQNFTRDAF